MRLLVLPSTALYSALLFSAWLSKFLAFPSTSRKVVDVKQPGRDRGQRKEFRSVKEKGRKRDLERERMER